MKLLHNSQSSMKKIFGIALLAIIFLGCEGFLDRTDPFATSFAEFFTGEGDPQRVTYSSDLDFFTPRNDRRLLHSMKDGRSDNAYARVSGDHHQVIANGNLNANSRLTEYYYTLHMKHIGRLNTYI